MKDLHTSGPWKLVGGEIRYEDDLDIAQVLGADDFLCRDDEQRDADEIECTANARLIVAAPDMLEALRAVKAFAPPGCTHIHKICDDAIANATGVKTV